MDSSRHLFRMVLESVTEEPEFMVLNKDNITSILKDAVFTLRKNYFNENKIEYDQITARQALEIHFSKEKYFSMLLLVNGEFAGEALCERMMVDGEYVKSCEILAFAVLRKYQDKGYGKKLMSKTIETIKERGHGSAFLLVRKDNEKAMKFYENFGFEKKIIKSIYHHSYSLEI